MNTLSKICLFVTLTFIINVNAQSDAQLPNIIFILADDLGYSELGSYGNSFNETPNLDKLAKRGIRFTQAYASAPVCSPYRAALMTGRYPARIGITDYLRPNSSDFLDTAYVTLPEQLKKKGYYTGIIGKWHLSGYKKDGALEETLPDKHGFDEVHSSEITGIGAGTYFYPYHFNPELKKKEKGQEYLIDRMNNEAVDFIKRNKKKPFFLYLSHYGVHTMVHGKEDLVKKYRAKPNSGKGAPSNNNPENDFYKKWPRDYFAKGNNPHLAAQLETIDEGVGMIRDELERLGLDQNTLIIFTSDNGGELRVTDNQPLHGGKSELYEGGIRIPLLVYMPTTVSGGEIIEKPTSNYDFYPTLCQFAGISEEFYPNLDGQVIPEIFSDNKNRNDSTSRVFYWHYPLKSKHFLGGRSAGAIRDGDWKLIEFFDTSERELYDLKKDPAESNNIISQHPKIADSLQHKLIDWRNEVGAKFIE